jgi:hypothetical protein
VSGETEASVSGWTTDTLREHLLQKLADQRDALRQQILDQRDAFQQQLTDLRGAYQQQLADLQGSDRQHVADMREMLNERYATQTKALDAAFLAQQTAMRTALEAAEKAVATALTSAEKAVAKAEVAADKRFESVNEFRQQLSDQTATFPTRNEVNTRLDAIRSDTDRNQQRIGELELRLTSRLDLTQGTAAGADFSRSEYRLNVNTVLQALAVIAAAVIVFAAFHH